MFDRVGMGRDCGESNTDCDLAMWTLIDIFNWLSVMYDNHSRTGKI